MSTATALGSNEVERKAASDANAVQDGVNLAFTSKLNSLCRMTLEREMAALSAVAQIEAGEAVEFEVIPL